MVLISAVNNSTSTIANPQSDFTILTKHTSSELDEKLKEVDILRSENSNFCQKIINCNHSHLQCYQKHYQTIHQKSLPLKAM